MRPKGKLRNKIFLILIMVSVVPILIEAFLSSNIVNVTHRSDIARLEDEALGQKEAEIKAYVDNQILGQTKISFSSNATSETALYADEPLCLKAKTNSDFEKCTDEGRKLIFAQLFGTNKSIVEVSAISLLGQELARFNFNDLNNTSSSALRDLSEDPGFLSAKQDKDYLGPVIFDGSNPEITVASRSE